MATLQHQGIGRERASADYERPAENVAEMQRPPKLPATKARQGGMRGHVRTVLIVGMALTIVAFVIGYLIVR
jgi:hypothetical protein